MSPRGSGYDWRPCVEASRGRGSVEGGTTIGEERVLGESEPVGLLRVFEGPATVDFYYFVGEAPRTASGECTSETGCRSGGNPCVGTTAIMRRIVFPLQDTIDEGCTDGRWAFGIEH